MKLSTIARYRMAAAGALSLILAMTLSACGGSGDNSAKTDRILRYGVDLTTMGGPQFDPVNSSKALVAGRNSWTDLIYDRLIYRDESGELQPGLLSSWKVIDPLTLEVTARKGVKFQDGTGFDAKALKFNWDRDLADDTLAKPADFQNVKRIEVVSKYIARIHYSTPSSAFTLNNTFVLSRGFGAIASPAAVKKLGDKFNRNPVGAGPYEFDSFETGQRISVRKWDGYWNPEAQHLDGVDFIQTARGAATIAALQSGRIDIARITEADIPTIESQGGLKAISEPGSEVLYFFVNLNRPPFDTLEAREALSFAFDRDAINQAAYAGHGDVTNALYYPGSPFSVPSLDVRFKYDPQRAADMLRKAGVESGTTIEAVVQNIPSMQAAAEVIQAQLKDVGINLKISVTPNFVDEIRSDPDCYVASTVNYNIPGAFLASDGTYNLGYHSEAFEKAVQMTLGAPDKDTLTRAYTESQQALLDDLPIYFIAQEPISLGMSEAVSGVGDVRSDLEGPVLADVRLK